MDKTEKGRAASVVRARKRNAVLKGTFLATYIERGSIRGASDDTGISRSNHMRWMKSDPKYAAAFSDAQEQAIELLETEARRRAMVGTEEPVFQGGKHVGNVRKYSDVLLIFLLKASRPSKYRDFYNSGQGGDGASGGPLPVVFTMNVNAISAMAQQPVRELTAGSAYCTCGTPIRCSIHAPGGSA